MPNFWKIREEGQSQYVPFEINPSTYQRSRQVDASYEQLVDGDSCRIVSPKIYKKEDIQVVWANVTQTQYDLLKNYLNKKVEVVDHNLETFAAYVDGIERQYLISASPVQRYAITLKVREV
jgi:hypothetical protein